MWPGCFLKKKFGPLGPLGYTEKHEKDTRRGIVHNNVYIIMDRGAREKEKNWYTSHELYSPHPNACQHVLFRVAGSERLKHVCFSVRVRLCFAAAQNIYIATYQLSYVNQSPLCLLRKQLHLPHSTCQLGPGAFTQKTDRGGVNCVARVFDAFLF